MIKQFFIILLFTTGVWANDIYVVQTSDTDNSTQDQVAFQEPSKQENSEKMLLSDNNDNTYCSIIAGCYTKD